MTKLSIALALIAFFSMPSDTASEASADVHDAIASIRGHDPQGMSDRALAKLHQRLDDAWEVLGDHPRIAETAIRETLGVERDDDFLITDLSQLLLYFDPKRSTMLQVAGWIQRTEPNAYPPGYFRVSSILAMEQCVDCLPAVVRMLELRELNDAIAQHALPVDIELGLLFTLGPFGVDAETVITNELKSSNCIVRRNAATILPFLLPDAIPEALPDILSNDTCIESRLASWKALGVLDGAILTAMARKAMARELPEEEIRAIVAALSSTYYPPAREALRELAESEDERLAGIGRSALENTADRDDIEMLVSNVGSAGSGKRSRARKQLKRAEKKGRFDFDGDAFELEAALEPGDLPLVKKALASVLRRRSDECLYEWKTLFLTATILKYVRDRE